MVLMPDTFSHAIFFDNIEVIRRQKYTGPGESLEDTEVLDPDRDSPLS